MKRSMTLLLFSLLSSAGLANAATPESACANLAEARTELVGMVAETNPAKLDDLKAKVHAASDKLDADLATMASGADAAKAAEFQPVWEAFKKTRETEIIPDVYAGKNADAKAIATGIQAERMAKMKAIMGCQ
jgi:LysM repeat protein